MSKIRVLVTICLGKTRHKAEYRKSLRFLVWKARQLNIAIARFTWHDVIFVLPERQVEEKSLRNMLFLAELKLFSIVLGDVNINSRIRRGKKRSGLSHMWRNLHDVNVHFKNMMSLFQRENFASAKRKKKRERQRKKFGWG